MHTCDYKIDETIMGIKSRYKSRDSTSACYYKSLDLIRINDYKIWNANQTISKSCFVMGGSIRIDRKQTYETLF